MKPLRLGVIGAGRIAEKHLEVLRACDDAHVVAIANRGHPRGRELAERFDIPRVYADYRAMLDREALDAVFVLVSVLDIPDVGAACLQLGLPALIEKPPGSSVHATRQLVEAAGRRNAIHMVGLNRRFYSVVHHARERVLQVGRVVAVVVDAPERLIEARALGHPPLVLDRFLVANGIHCIDLMRFFAGEVLRLDTVRKDWTAPDGRSHAAQMVFESGAVGHYMSNWTSPGRWSVTVYGEGITVTLSPLETGVVLRPGSPAEELRSSEEDLRFKPGLYAQNRYFLDHVRSGSAVSFPAADLTDALNSMQLAEAIAEGTSWDLR